MQNISCKYFEKDDDSDTDWVDQKMYSGRSVLHCVMSLGVNLQDGSATGSNPNDPLTNTSEYIRRIIIFYDSDDVSSLTKEKYRFINTMGGNGDSDDKSNKVIGKEICVNIPGDGILFENGIVARIHKTCLGVSVFASGGAA